jgi:hypothetical protein
MIDTATIERYMRDANPIPHIDDLDADEFARFVAAATTRRAAIMQAPTQHQTTPSTTPQPLRSRRAWVFAAAFILILAAVGIAALVLRGDGATVTDEPAPPTTMVETPGEPISIESLTWSRIPHDEAVFGGSQHPGEAFDGIFDVTAGGPGLVAVGAADRTAAVWTSPDGYTWSRVPQDDPAFASGGDSAILSVTRGGPGLVAVGYSDEVMWHPAMEEKQGGWSSDELEALGIDMRPGTCSVWTSADGYTWARVDFDFDGCRGHSPGGLHHVIAGDFGLFALFFDGEGAVGWYSTDGLAWDLSEPSDFAFEGSPRVVIAGGPGFVAVGDGLAWTSADGITWSQSSLPLDETYGDLRSVHASGIAVGGPGLVAVGDAFFDPPGDEDLEIHAVVWTSPDGYTWSVVSLGDEQSVGARMNGVIATETGLVAVGESLEGNAVWTSPDGITWFRAPLDESVADGGMSSVTVGGPGLVAVGADDISGPNDPDSHHVGAVWIAEPKD